MALSSIYSFTFASISVKGGYICNIGDLDCIELFLIFVCLHVYTPVDLLLIYERDVIIVIVMRLNCVFLRKMRIKYLGSAT